MYVDGGVSLDLNTVGAQAAEMEDMGYAGVMTAETAHDPFFPLLVAAQNTQRIELMTSIAVARAIANDPGKHWTRSQCLL